MKTVHLAIDDQVLSSLVREQLAHFTQLSISDQNPDLVIAQAMSDIDAPHLLLGPRHVEGAECLSLPLKLGALRDQLRYMLSGRERFAQHEIIEFAGFTLNTEDGIMEKGAVKTRLTDKEKLILQTLYDADDAQMDRKNLLHAVWGYVETVETHTLETHLYRLRQKLEETFGATDLITTKDGVYSLKS